jgi:hypothetical protein
MQLTVQGRMLSAHGDDTIVLFEAVRNRKQRILCKYNNLEKKIWLEWKRFPPFVGSGLRFNCFFGATNTKSNGPYKKRTGREPIRLESVREEKANHIKDAQRINFGIRRLYSCLCNRY